MSAVPPDDPLNERLNKLKGHAKSIDQRELEERIARLKGIDPAKFTVPPITVYRPPDTRSDIQKADDLMMALMNETAIDTSLDCASEKATAASIEEIERRLQSLRGASGNNEGRRPVLNDDSDAEMDSDTECEIIAKKLVEEAKLPQVDDSSSSNVKSVSKKGKKVTNESDDEENENSVPWCVICNEDAAFVCKDCDDDLYCIECFQ